MKKFAIACAIVLAAGLSSCGDTNMCYEVSVKVTGVPELKSYYWGTSNDLKAYEQDLKDKQKALGISEDAITVTHSKANKSQDDCKN